MPWTFAHPAAVLPLRKLGRWRMNSSALVIGSFSPDLGYYAFQYDGTWFGHTFFGSLVLCLPSSLLLLVSFYALRRPLCYMLPQPHRQALLPLAKAKPPCSASAAIIACASILLGAWTHILWDSFTHVDRWFVARIGWLQAHVVTIRGHEFHGHSLAQYASSIIGVAILVAAYALWLSKVTSPRERRWFVREDGWRYAAIGGTVLVAMALAIPSALELATRTEGLFGLRVFVVRALVGSTTWFAASFVTLALICYWRRPRPERQQVL